LRSGCFGDKLHGVPGFPVPLRNLLEHIVISHHGKLEFGSPKLPQFPEAILLHYLDDMDSKMESMRALSNPTGSRALNSLPTIPPWSGRS